MSWLTLDLAGLNHCSGDDPGPNWPGLQHCVPHAHCTLRTTSYYLEITYCHDTALFYEYRDLTQDRRRRGRLVEELPST